jgi:SAM-dependent methyltransferase
MRCHPEEQLMNSFDLVAARFERYRSLPSYVPIAIREALHMRGGINARATLLEVGCGTGRIGAAFNAAGDNYVGIDSSIAMLHEFRKKKSAQRANLVRADGCRLPFGDRTFKAVLMVPVLAVPDWHVLLTETHRVLQSDGVLAIGRIERPTKGIDAVMRNRLGELMAGMGITELSPDRGVVGEWLRARSSRHIEIRPARWTLDHTPREFFLRKATAGRFASLPAAVREAALRSLADWTEQTIGPLDRAFRQTHDFSLELYWF